ncbi:MAG: adenylosuccinate lyase, partial [Desulfurococcales archaeon]|nr:adenylosuccinate lyase [Desulfurococcales archaeon]
GKVSGAVGTMAAWGEKGPKVEEVALSTLGLRPHAITTQVAPRDGYAELVATIAILASQLDRLALEVRELSRNEIGELYIAAGRVGSSTMPHKRNPTIAERVSGLARICRALVVTALENIPLMHERDLTNSSSERFLIPHALLTIDQLLIDTHRMLSTLEADEVAMKRNLELSRGAIMAECLMIKLVLKAGVPRHKAHSMLSDLARQALAQGREFRDVVAGSEAGKLLSSEDIEECFNYSKYLGSYDFLINRSLNYAKEVLRRC